MADHAPGIAADEYLLVIGWIDADLAEDPAGVPIQLLALAHDFCQNLHRQGLSAFLKVAKNIYPGLLRTEQQ